jgi:membrane-associated phospholipid phosphatase
MNSPRCIGILLLALFAGGCATHPTKGNWGERATLTPGWERIGAAARNAASDPKTWVPALGAAVFLLGDLDEQVSDWAIRETPLFGSQEDAAEAADDLRQLTGAATLITALGAASGEVGGDGAEAWLANKGRGIALDLAAIGVNDLLTNGLKDLTGRERPNGLTETSFPSGHASQSAVRATLASRNLQYLEMPDWTRTSLDVGLYSLAAATAWARVESAHHYPSDVLAGFALGHFVAAFVNDAFMGEVGAAGASIALQALPGGAELVLRLLD